MHAYLYMYTLHSMVKRRVGITVFLSFTHFHEEDQTANIDTDVLGQFGHKKSEKHKVL